MKIPRLFFGTGAEVHASAKRFLTKVIKKGNFPEFQESDLMDTDDLVEANALPLVMFRGDPSKSSEDHFRVYVFLNYDYPQLYQQQFHYFQW
jgi:hypothetical protein